MNNADKSETLDGVLKQAYNQKLAEPYTWTHLSSRIIWDHCMIFALYHLAFVAALFTYAFGLHSVPIQWRTIIWGFVVGFGTFFGSTAGAHRLWSHRSYKAKLLLKILLMACYCMMGLNPLYYWIRDHRVHHKYSETDADPHNAKRGFIFSHVGWIVMKRHPDCIRRGREMDMSDILADPVVMFQLKHHLKLKLLLCFVIPTLVPVMFWKETVIHSVLTQCFIRYILFLNIIFLVNSAAHVWGSRPYNRLINPAENIIVSLLTLGEGSHNYHHTFPWDYKTSELSYFNFNATTLLIDAMAKIGWAYDRKEPSQELVDKVVHGIGYKSAVKTTLNEGTKSF